MTRTRNISHSLIAYCVMPLVEFESQRLNEVFPKEIYTKFTTEFVGRLQNCLILYMVMG